LVDDVGPDFDCFVTFNGVENNFAECFEVLNVFVFDCFDGVDDFGPC